MRNSYLLILLILILRNTEGHVERFVKYEPDRNGWSSNVNPYKVESELMCASELIFQRNKIKAPPSVAYSYDEMSQMCDLGYPDSNYAGSGDSEQMEVNMRASFQSKSCALSGGLIFTQKNLLYD